MKVILLAILFFSFFYGHSGVEDHTHDQPQKENKIDNSKKTIFEKKGELSREEVNFLESLSPQVAPEIIPYSFFAIKPKKSYPASLYEKSEKKLIYEENQNRIKQAKIYKESGNISEFSEILLDLFTYYNYSLVAPEAAMLLGDFEYLIYNLEAALTYYLYVVNNHFYSPWGEEAYLKLGLTLAKQQHFLEATKIMQEILADSKSLDLQKQAKDFLQKRYLLLAKVDYQEEKYDEAKKYLEKYFALE